VTTTTERGKRIFDVILIAGLISVAFILRYINYTNIIGYPDEFTYYYRALATLSYNWGWSKQFMLDQPPIYMYLLSITTYLYNSQLDTFRMLSVIFGSLTAGFVYLLGKSMFNRFTGLVAASFFAFSGFDILYSRLAQQEALTLFLITASLYFFWLGVMGKQRNLKYAIMGGIFLGLGFDTKYITFLLPVSFIAFFLIMGEDWLSFRLLKKDARQRLLSKEFLLLLLIAFLVLLPVLVDQFLHGADAFYWDLLGKFVNASSPFYKSANLGNTLASALSSFTQLLAFVSSFQPTSQVIFPPYQIFSTLTQLSFLVIIVYYLRASFKRWNRETFIFVLFLVATVFFFLYPTRFQYYQLYTFPAYPLMFARFFDRVSTRFLSGLSKGFKAIGPVVLVCFVLLLLVFSMGIVAGVASAKYGQGANDGLISFFQTVKASGNPNVEIAVTPVEGLGFVTYYLDQMNISARVVTLDAIASAQDPPSIKILEAPLQSAGIVQEVITLEPLAVYQPQYLVLGQAEYQLVFTSAMKLFIAQSYTLLMSSSGFVIFQRFQNSTVSLEGAG
jgi:4-amino-4-deoxy-L-arabinose transferase-like glycosyltransferase